MVLCEKWKALVEGFHENPSLQSKDNIVPRNDERKIKQNLKLLHSQSKKWRPYNRNALCWSIFYVNDNVKMMFDALQIMHYILCYSNHVLSFNPIMKLRNNLTFCYKTSGICLRNMLMQTIKKFEKIWTTNWFWNEWKSRDNLPKK